MFYKKREEEKRRIERSVVILILILIFLGIFIFNKPLPSITGKVITGKATVEEAVYSENLNLQVNESGAYEIKLKNPGSIKSLKASGTVSSNGTARVYVEKNGTRYLLFDSSKQLFDVNIHVLPEYKKILQGGELLIQNILFNLRGFGAGDVNVRYSIQDSRGNIIAAEEETVFIETQAKFIRKLVMPAEIKPGTYLAFVEASANGTIVGTGSDTFEVTSKYEYRYPPQLKYYLIGVAALVAIAIIVILGIYQTKILKKKKAIAELKEKVPLERKEKLEKELKALESAYKSGFMSEESYQRERKRIEDRLSAIKK